MLEADECEAGEGVRVSVLGLRGSGVDASCISSALTCVEALSIEVGHGESVVLSVEG